MAHSFFEAQPLILQQIPDQHHGLLEMNVHWGATLLLLVVGVIVALILFSRYRRISNAGTALAMSALYAGLIGAGEAFEHLGGHFNHDFWHYLHMLSGLFATLFIWRALRLTRKPAKDAWTWLYGVSLVIVVGLSLMFAFFSSEAWDPHVEWVFFVITLVPMLVLSAMALLELRAVWRVHRNDFSLQALLVLPHLTVLIVLLSLDIFFGRVAAQLGSSSGYIITHAVQDILHVATAMTLIVFAGLVWKIGELYSQTEFFKR